MIKVTYYIGTNDKNTYKKELLDIDFYKVFDELFINYTLLKTQGVYTMKNNGTIIKENSFIVITFIDECKEKELRKLIRNNCDILKSTLNQETILVEVTDPGIMFC